MTLLVSLLVAASSAGSAQHLLEVLARRAGPVRAGEWVTFRARGETGEHFIRLAAVGEEPRTASGPAQLWLELEAGVEQNLGSPLVSLRLLWPKEPNGELSKVASPRGWASVGGGTTQPLPRHVLRTWTDRGPGVVQAAAAPEAVRTGRGVVPSVRVELVYNAQVVQQMWMSEAVPLLHLARLEIPALGYVIEAVDYGWDARPKIASPSGVGAEEGARDAQRGP